MSIERDIREALLIHLSFEQIGRYAVGKPNSSSAREQQPVVPEDEDDARQVQMVFDEILGRPVVRKTLHTDGLVESAGPDSLSSQIQRFIKEARITAQLEHPNILTAYELARTREGDPYYTMQALSGSSLQEVIEQCATLEERLTRTLSAFLQVCHAVAYAHSRGVIHRAIHPGNILVGEFGETFLLGWGRAIQQGEADAWIEQIESALSSTPSSSALDPVHGLYQSPEQASGRFHTVDQQSDIWSLGAVLCFILTGRPPQPRTSILGPSVAVATGEQGMPIPVRQLLPGCPPELAAVVDKAQRWNKADRYLEAGELARDIDAFQSGERVSAMSYGPGRLLGRFASRHKWGLAAALVFLLALTTSLVLVTLAWEREVRAGLRSQFQIAEALNDKATELVGQGKLLTARLHAAASLLHNPANPHGQFFQSEFARQTPFGKFIRAEATGHLFQTRSRIIRGIQQVFVLDSETTRGDLSPDDRWLAAGDMDGGLHLWDLGSGQLHWQVRNPNGGIWRTVFSPDSQHLLAVGHSGQAEMYHVASGRMEREVLKLDRGWLLSAAFTADGRSALLGDSAGVIRKVRLADGLVEFAAQGHRDRVYDLVLFGDGQRFASASRDGTIRIFNTMTGRLLDTWHIQHGAVRSLALSPDGTVVAAGSSEGQVLIFDAGRGYLSETLDAHAGGVYGLDFSADGKWLLSTSMDGLCKLWRTGSWALDSAVMSHLAPVWHGTFSTSGDRFASFSRDNTVRLWSLDPKLGLRRYHGHKGHVLSVRFSPDGRWLASGATDKTVRIWDLASGKTLHVLRGLEHFAAEILFTPDRQRLIASDFSGNIRVWSTATGQLIGNLDGHKEVVNRLKISADGRRLYSASYDRSIRIWRIDGTPSQEDAIQVKEKIHSFDLMPDGRKLILGLFDGSVALFDLASGRVEKTRQLHCNITTGVALSHDGSFLALGGKDGLVSVWDPYFEHRRFVARGHTDMINRLVVSPDDRWLLTGGDDRRAIVWSARTGDPHLVIRAAEFIQGIDMSPDGKWLVIGDGDDVVLYPFDLSLYDADSNALYEQARRDTLLKLNGFDLEVDLPADVIRKGRNQAGADGARAGSN